MSRVRIEPDVATGLLDFPFLGGSHSDFLPVLARCRLKGKASRYHCSPAVRPFDFAQGQAQVGSYHKSICVV